MGYDTQYRGAFLFEPVTPEVLQCIGDLLEDEYVNARPEYPKPASEHERVWSALELELNDDNNLCWTSCERSYDLDYQLNILVHMVRQKFPEFKITGGDMSMLEEGGEPLFIIPTFTGEVMRVEAIVAPCIGKGFLDELASQWNRFGMVKEEDLQTDEEKAFRQNFRDFVDAMSDDMHGRNRSDNCVPYKDN